MSVVWGPESQLSSWIGNSILLMTGALVFYGFTKLDDPTVQVNPYISAFVCIGLIIIDVCISITAIIPYNDRVDKVLDSTSEEHIDYDKEENTKTTYIILLSCFVFLQVIICYYVVVDSIRRVENIGKKGRRRKRKGGSSILKYIA